MTNVNPGLRPLPHDPRDFKLGALFRLPSVSEIPKEFELPRFSVKDQGDSDKCTAFASAASSEMQEDVTLDPDWVFAVGKHMSGNPDEWGQDIRTAMMARVKYGILEQSDVEGITPSRYLKDWPAHLFEKAKKHKAQAVLRVTPSQGMDAFDTIRATLYKFRSEKRAIVTGIQFGYDPASKYFTQITDGPGHCMFVFAYEERSGVEYLKYADSYGVNVGENGYHLVTREVVNASVALYGAFMFVDMPKEDIKHMLDHGIKVGDNWVVQLLKVIKAIVTSPHLSLDEKVDIVHMTNETIKTIEPTPPQKSAADTLADAALAAVGTDVSPKNLAPNELSCAESMSTLIRTTIYPDFPICTGTATLFDTLRKDARFKATLTPQRGTLIVAPTVKPEEAHGHTGEFVNETDIVSTGGTDGKLKQNFTLESFVKRYKRGLGLRIELFDPVAPVGTLAS